MHVPIILVMYNERPKRNEQASEVALSCNKDLLYRIRYIGNKFLNSVEILSAQEVVCLVLRRSSRDCEYINTSNSAEITCIRTEIKGSN